MDKQLLSPINKENFLPITTTSEKFEKQANTVDISTIIKEQQQSSMMEGSAQHPEDAMTLTTTTNTTTTGDVTATGTPTPTTTGAATGATTTTNTTTTQQQQQQPPTVSGESASVNPVVEVGNKRKASDNQNLDLINLGIYEGRSSRQEKMRRLKEIQLQKELAIQMEEERKIFERKERQREAKELAKRMQQEAQAKKAEERRLKNEERALKKAEEEKIKAIRAEERAKLKAERDAAQAIKDAEAKAKVEAHKQKRRDAGLPSESEESSSSEEESSSSEEEEEEEEEKEKKFKTITKTIMEKRTRTKVVVNEDGVTTEVEEIYEVPVEVTEEVEVEDDGVTEKVKKTPTKKKKTPTKKKSKKDSTKKKSSSSSSASKKKKASSSSKSKSKSKSKKDTTKKLTKQELLKIEYKKALKKYESNVKGKLRKEIEIFDKEKAALEAVINKEKRKEDQDRKRAEMKRNTANKVKYPIDDALLSIDPPNKKLRNRPKTQTRLKGIPVYVTGDLLMIWEFCRTFSKELNLTKFTVEALIDAMQYQENDTILLAEIHMAILRLVLNDTGLHHAYSSNAVEELENEDGTDKPLIANKPDSSVVSPLTWQALTYETLPRLNVYKEILADFYDDDIHGIGEDHESMPILKELEGNEDVTLPPRLDASLKSGIASLKAKDHCKLSVYEKIVLLKTLVDAGYETELIQELLHENLNKRVEMRAKKRSEDFELKKKEREELAGKREEAKELLKKKMEKEYYQKQKEDEKKNLKKAVEDAAVAEKSGDDDESTENKNDNKKGKSKKSSDKENNDDEDDETTTDDKKSKKKGGGSKSKGKKDGSDVDSDGKPKFQPTNHAISTFLEEMLGAEYLYEGTRVIDFPEDEVTQMSDIEESEEETEEYLNSLDRKAVITRRKKIEARRKRNKEKIAHKEKIEHQLAIREQVTSEIETVLNNGVYNSIRDVKNAIKVAGNAGFSGTDKEGDWVVPIVRDLYKVLYEVEEKKELDKEERKFRAEQSKYFVRNKAIGYDKDGRVYWSFEGDSRLYVEEVYHVCHGKIYDQVKKETIERFEEEKQIKAEEERKFEEDLAKELADMKPPVVESDKKKTPKKTPKKSPDGEANTSSKKKKDNKITDGVKSEVAVTLDINDMDVTEEEANTATAAKGKEKITDDMDIDDDKEEEEEKKVVKNKNEDSVFSLKNYDPRQMVSVWSYFETIDEIRNLVLSLDNRGIHERELRENLIRNYAIELSPDMMEEEPEWKDEGSEHLGKHVRRSFEGRKVNGVINGWLPAEENEGLALWHVQHDDGDEEDLEEFEITDSVIAYEEYMKRPKRNDTRAAGSSDSSNALRFKSYINSLDKYGIRDEEELSLKALIASLVEKESGMTSYMKDRGSKWANKNGGRKAWTDKLTNAATVEELRDLLLEFENAIHDLQDTEDIKDNDSEEGEQEFWLTDPAANPMIGKRVRRFYDGKATDGTLTKFHKSTGPKDVSTWYMEHDDGDSEEMELNQVERAIKYFTDKLESKPEDDPLTEDEGSDKAEEEQEEDEGEETETEDEGEETETEDEDETEGQSSTLWSSYASRQRWLAVVSKAATKSILGLALVCLVDNSIEFGIGNDSTHSSHHRKGRMWRDRKAKHKKTPSKSKPPPPPQQPLRRSRSG